MWFKPFAGRAGSLFFRSLQASIMMIGLVAILVYVFSLAWERFGPHKPELSAARRELVNEVVPLVLADLRTNREALHVLYIRPIKGDVTDYVTDRLRSEIEQSGLFELVDRPLNEKVRKKLRLSLDGKSDQRSALASARGTGAQAVLYGEVLALESFKSGGQIELQISLARLDGSEDPFERKYARTLSSESATGRLLQSEAGKYSPAQRFLGWLILVLLLPMVTIAFIRAIVRKESNRSNAAALGIYTAVDALLAFLLFGASLTSWLSALIFVVLVGAALAYNVTVLTFALKLET